MLHARLYGKQHSHCVAWWSQKNAREALWAKVLSIVIIRSDLSIVAI
jgi:hypothetical protein